MMVGLKEEVAELKSERDLLVQKVASQNKDLKEAIDAQKFYKQQVDNLHGKFEAMKQHMEQEYATAMKALREQVHAAVMADVQELKKNMAGVQGYVSAQLSRASIPAEPPNSLSSLPSSSSMSSLSQIPKELEEQVDLTALQLGLVREGHRQLNSSTEQRIRVLSNEVAIHRLAIVAGLEKG